MTDLRIVLRQVLKTRCFMLVWYVIYICNVCEWAAVENGAIRRHKTPVILAYVPQCLADGSHSLQPVLSIERRDVHVGRVLIPLDNRVAPVRVLPATVQDRLTHTFAICYGPSSRLLRLRAPTGESCELWRTAIAAVINMGCDDQNQCDRFTMTMEISGVDGHDAIATYRAEAIQPMATALLPPAPSSPVDGEAAWRWSRSRPSSFRAPPSTTIGQLVYHLRVEIILADHGETWRMEARKNLLLRAFHDILHIESWTSAAALAVLRLSTIHRFEWSFDLGDELISRRRDGGAFGVLPALATLLVRTIYVVEDGEEDRAPMFRIYARRDWQQEVYPVSGRDWVVSILNDVLKAQRSPLILHATDHRTCSLMRFAELQPNGGTILAVPQFLPATPALETFEV